MNNWADCIQTLYISSVEKLQCFDGLGGLDMGYLDAFGSVYSISI